MAEPTNEYYANSVNMGIGLYDVTLIFSAQVPVIAEPGKTAMVQSSQNCIVRMSPQHAKALAALLVKHVKQYEQQFGMTLPLEPNIQEIWVAEITGAAK